MNLLAFGVVAATLMTASAVPSGSTTPTPKSVYRAEDGVPHATYGYADVYGNPLDTAYLYPVKDPRAESNHQGYNYAPAAQAPQGALAVSLRILAKIGIFFMGGLTLFAIGTLFTSVVCSLTPLCTISFMGFGRMNPESMRALMSPDRISGLAALVQDAIGKYQRLQRMTNN